MKKGFTIVETLVAISILLIAIAGAFSAVSTSISSGAGAKSQLVAFNLAAEGVEEVRNVRDQNGLAGSPWLAGIANSSSDPCWFGRACTVDAPANVIAACSGGAGTCPALLIDPANGFYGYNPSWSASGFTREVLLTQISPDEVSILVTVSWKQGTVTRTFRVRDNIMNWQ